MVERPDRRGAAKADTRAPLSRACRQDFCCGFRRAEASEKMTRQQAEYQDTPNGIYSCAVCTLFEPPEILQSGGR